MANTLAYRIFLISLIIILTIVGIFIGIQLVKNDPINESAVNAVNNDEDIKKEEEQVEVYVPQKLKTYDIELIYEDYYTLCKESIINKNIVYGITLEELKKREEEKQEKLKLDYKVVEENNERLVYKKEIEKYCPNHFRIILDENSSVVKIYSLDDDKNVNLYQEIEVFKDNIRNELKKELKNGIEVNSVEELGFMIEDVES